MAQTKTIQLLRSSQAYANLELAKAGIQDAPGTRMDGELLLGRYWSGTGSSAVIKSIIGIYHAAPDLTGDNIANGTTKGWTFIQDITSSTEGLQHLQNEVDLIETALGFNEDGTKDAFDDTDALQIISANDTIVDAVEKVAKALGALDKTASAVDGKVVTTVSQSNGLVSETKEDLTDIKMGGYSKTADTGAIAATDTLEVAVSKLENGIASATVKSTDKTVNITDNSGKDLSVNIDGTTLVKDATEGTISSALKVIKVIQTGTAGTDEVVDGTLGTNIKEAYRLVYNGSNTAIGKQINVYKDSALSRVYLGHMDDTIDTSTGNAATTGTGDTALCFVYHKEDGTYELVPVNVQSFLQESEFADGLQVANHVVSVKIDPDSEKDSQSTPVDFLSVSSNGVKVSGIKDEIDRKIAALDVTDTAVDGQYVSAVNETDGKVAMTRANVSEAVLNNYAKGTAPAALDIASTDTINQAFAKLEYQIDAVNAVVDDLDAEVTSSDGTNVQVKVTEVDGVITAVNVTDNSINATDLSDAIGHLVGSAIATAASGNVYTVLTGVTEVDGVISKASEVTLAAVAKTGAAADVTVADSGEKLTATNVEDALAEIVTKADASLNSVSSANGVIAVAPKDNSKNQQLTFQVSAKCAKQADGTTNMLTIENDGLALSNVWDCGVF